MIEVSTGKQLAEAGWRQGSIVKSEDRARILEIVGKQDDEGIVLLLASHSCDITHDNIEADPKDKLRREAKKANQHLSGIYVKITPDEEIAPDAIYRVNLLGLLSASFVGDTRIAETALDEYAAILRAAGMEVESAVRKENEMTIDVLRRFKRFYYDDLSFRADTPLPPETETIL